MICEYKSASHYWGHPDNNKLIDHLRARFNGYYEIKLNLIDFINYNNLSMILNNEIINNDSFELYNFDDLLTDSYEEIKSELEQEIENVLNNNDELESTTYLNDFLNSMGYELKHLKENYINIDDFQDCIDEIAIEEVYNIDVYQYFIIDDPNTWEEFTDYPIYYSDDLDLYLLGITHYGMSWKFFSTDFIYREYI